MAKINIQPVGSFGTALYDKITEDSRGIQAICDDLGMTQKAVYSHVKRTREPHVGTINIYSKYLNIPAIEIRKMLYDDWGRVESTKFGRELLDILCRHDLTIRSLSKNIEVSEQTIHRWLRGDTPTSRNYVKLMRYVCKLEGLIDTTVGGRHGV